VNNVDDGERARLAELKHFLRARRAAVAPSDVGLPMGARRRTPGLRRDEVAQLAGIGSTWYTFLEQGRKVRPSSGVLDRLSSVFRLSPPERRHLYQLALGTFPDEGSPHDQRAVEDLRRLLAALDPWPAYVLDHYFDMIAWNAAGSLVFDYSDATPLPERNVIRRLMTDPAKRRLHLDYEVHARNTIAAFRPHFSRHATDPVMQQLVSELSARSSDFVNWWSRHEVLDSDRLKTTIRLAHPSLGELVGRFAFLSIFGEPDLTLCIFTPEPTDGTEAALRAAVG
jgi:transcriptional regulator with XRE-family HTH domain